MATTYAEWIAALELAIMWDFKEVSLPEDVIIDLYFSLYIFVFGTQIRKTCIRALSALIESRPVIDIVLLAKKYKVKEWLRAGYIKLLQSKELELGDDICTSEIDVITIARLLYIRERRHGEIQRNTQYCHRCSRTYGYDFSTDIANRKIDEVFADEIAGMQGD